MQAGGGGGGGGGEGDSRSVKEAEEKMKRLRKRNADLVGLVKTVEERCKSLKLDNDKLVSDYQISTLLPPVLLVMLSQWFCVYRKYSHT